MLKDKDIREPLFDFFDEKFGKVRIIEEKQIAKSRADVMLVLEETLVGVEIKSDADTYTRLARQIKDYNKFFDYNYVVVGSSHSKHIDEHIREYWGIIVATEDEGDISKEVYEEKKGAFKKQIGYIDSELLKRDVKNSAIVSNVKTQIQLLTDLLGKKYDVISGDIPEDIVETFIDQIVVHDDYFEWRLRTSTELVLCKVEGNEKDNTNIFLENDSHKVAAQYRQLLLTSNTLISERNIIT